PEEGVSPEDSFLVGEEELIVEELINVKNNFNIQFFIDKDKSIYCIGYGIQITTDDGEYEGTICFLNNDPNPKLLEVTNDACANIAERGYFGFLGFDVLEDDNGDYYIVDANIRINGSTSVHLIKDKLLPKLGDYAYMTSFDLGAESPTEAIEKISEYGILLSLSHKEQGKYKAFAMFAVETNKPEDAISKVNEFLEANK
ncbi:MAG: ATP-grasp domain-containing protein, partial [Candidatus Aenigmatarchaeota archaeon]